MQWSFLMNFFGFVFCNGFGSFCEPRRSRPIKYQQLTTALVNFNPGRPPSRRVRKINNRCLSNIRFHCQIVTRNPWLYVNSPKKKSFHSHFVLISFLNHSASRGWNFPATLILLCCIFFYFLWCGEKLLNVHGGGVGKSEILLLTFFLLASLLVSHDFTFLIYIYFFFNPWGFFFLPLSLIFFLKRSLRYNIVISSTCMSYIPPWTQLQAWTWKQVPQIGTFEIGSTESHPQKAVEFREYDKSTMSTKKVTPSISIWNVAFATNVQIRWKYADCPFFLSDHLFWWKTCGT